MATMKDVRSRAKALGADVEVLRKRPLDMQVLAPVGRAFEGGLHILVGHDLMGEDPGRVYADLLQRMERGVEPCRGVECGCVMPVRRIAHLRTRLFAACRAAMPHLRADGRLCPGP
jgi:hypothetical protein